MKFLSKLKSSLKRGFTVLCATVMVLTSGILTGTELTASAAKLNGSAYLSDVLYQNSGNQYQETREQWQAFLTEYSTGGQKNYYLGTPYNSSLYAASPKGNQWQGYSGMNCQGFVWYIISHGLAYYNKVPVSQTSQYVPNLAKFNQKGYSYKCWNGGGWYAFVTQNNLHYYEFGSKSEMLSSGVLQKGDIIWCVNAAYGSGINGLSHSASDHHVGIYMGNGKSDSWWQSGPVSGDGNTTGEINSINQIYGKAKNNTYVVIPWAEQKEASHFDPTRLRIQKVDSETGQAVPQGNASLAGAEFTMKYYSGTSATGNPARTWVLTTGSNGVARLDKDHLKSGTMFTDKNGNAYLPLGTVVIQETKAPTGYKLSSTVRTLHIVEQNGKAVIQEDGSNVFQQEYTGTYQEEVVRGDLSFNKADGSQRPLAYIPFLLTNTDTNESHIIMTDVNGKFSSKSGRGRTNLLDDYKTDITSSGGELSVPDTAMIQMELDGAVQQAGVWFGAGAANSTSGALLCGNYKLQELRCKNNAGYKLITRQFSISSSVTDYNAGTLIDTANPGSIVGKKVDEDGKGLAGAVLGLFTPDTTEFTLKNTYTGMTAVSGEDGSFTFENVPNGKYVVHEITPPDGYLLSDQSYPVTVQVNTANEEVQLGEDIVNHPTTIAFFKADEDGNALSGAKMSIFELGSTSAVDSWTTDSSSHTVTAKLAVGKKYEYWESAAPDGYIKADPIYFTIQADGSVTDLDGNPITLQMVDHATQVEISKYNDSEEPLSGAKMQILDSDKNVVEEWITDGTTHVIRGKLIYGKTYTLHEAAAPTGYYTAEDMEFTVGKDTVSIGMVDDATWAGILKTDGKGHDVIGAVLQVKDKSGNVIEEWTTDGTRHEMRAVLNPDETYTLHEVSAPEGYFLSEDMEFTAGQRVVMTDIKQTDLTVGKLSDIQEQTAGQDIIFLPGAVLQILDKDDNMLDEWTTENAQHVISKVLTPGETYTLHEVSAPDGYCVAEDIHFTLNDKGEFVKSDDYESGEMWIRMKDLATKIEIRKVDENGKPLSGAALQIIATDADGKETLVDSWITDGSVHQIYGKLIAGQTYILREASAPKGYAKAADQQFTVGTNGKVQNITMQDIATKVGIDKVDEDGKPLSGAVLQLLDAAGTEIDQWTTDGTTHRIDAVLTAGAEYTLHEVSAPDGYCIAADQKFTVNADGSLTSVKLTNLSTKVQISKTTLTGDTELEGAKLEVRDLSGNALDSWTSGKEAHMITAKLTAGQTYVLHETAAPNGYVVSNDIEFTVNADGTVTKVIMKDDTTKVEISKVTEENKPLSGAALQILDKDENVLDEWITDGTTHTLTAKLTAGQTYTLREAAAPAGYYKAKDITFTVNANGTANAITLYNIKTKVEITKYDITGTNPLPGAKLQVKDLDGNVMDEWTSADKAYVIEGVLVSGQTYILHEETAPDGYVLADDMQFTVNPDGTITTVDMKDDTTKVSITKKDITGENEIAGAVLEVRDTSNNIIDSWVSDGTAHEISGILTAGAKYILHEVSAPDGYVVATDVEFIVDANGKVTEVTMLDDTTKLHVTKKDITGEKELAGAALEVKDTDGNIIDAWVSDGTEHQIIGVLAVGKKYILHEVSAPDGYVVAEDVEFEVNADGSITRVEMRDDTTKVAITKYEITGEKELPGASMQLLDSKSNVVDAWISTDKAHEIIGVLTAGETYTLHEVSAPNGYVVAADASFTVNTDGSINVVSMYDDTTKVSISKTDITTGSALAGATLQIIDQNDNVIEEWVSTEEAHLIEAVLTAGETYTLRETSAPAGYVIAENVSFTVNPDGSVTHVEMQDDTTKVSISKTDITGEKELAGAALEVRDANDNVIDAWVSDGTAHQINGVLVAGQTYTLHEVSAPNGYVVAEDVTFTVNEDGSVNMVSMADAPTSVHISKKDITTGEELPGAFLELYDKDNNLVDSWVSTNEAHIIEAVLIAGEKYTLIETSAPNGYVISEKVEFTVNLDNTITHVEMLDKTTKVQISKKAITGEDELPGAVMQVLDKDNNIIDQWTSGSEPHMIEGVLIAGQTYVLHEVSAPNGYTLAKDVTFTVSETGEIDYVQMIDDTTKVSISKTDITGEKNVSGATLQIIDKNGNVIHEWISGTDVNYMEAQLTAGETYTLHETNAPAGYVLAQDQQFTVNPDGTITKVNMKDDTTKVSITKYDLTSGKELPGATLQIIDKNGNVIEEWISASEAHLIEGILTAGETYTLREISAPNGWTISEDVTFTVNADGTITHVEMYDKPTSVSLRKVDTDGNDIKGAVMQLLDKDGNVVEEWTTDGNAHVLTAQLIAGETYTLHEKSAPAGYELAKDQTFTVPDDGEITVTMTDEKTPTTPPVATPTTPTPISTASPKTGDAAPVMAIGTGLLASFLIMLLTRKKKRKASKAA